MAEIYRGDYGATNPVDEAIIEARLRRSRQRLHDPDVMTSLARDRKMRVEVDRIDSRRGLALQLGYEDGLDLDPSIANAELLGQGVEPSQGNILKTGVSTKVSESGASLENSGLTAFEKQQRAKREVRHSLLPEDEREAAERKAQATGAKTETKQLSEYEQQQQRKLETKETLTDKLAKPVRVLFHNLTHLPKSKLGKVARIAGMVFGATTGLLNPFIGSIGSWGVYAVIGLDRLINRTREGRSRFPRFTESIRQFAIGDAVGSVAGFLQLFPTAVNSVEAYVNKAVGAASSQANTALEAVGRQPNIKVPNIEFKTWPETYDAFKEQFSGAPTTPPVGAKG